MQDSPGQPKDITSENGHDSHPAQDTHEDTPGQEIFLSTAQAATLLDVDARSVRRYINTGIRTPTGIVKLPAQEIFTTRGKQLQIEKRELDRFKQTRDHGATEGQTAGASLVTKEAENQALAQSLQLISDELERRNLALQDAQGQIERLAREAGQNEGLKHELELTQQRLEEIKQQRDFWQQKATARKLYRINLFPIKEE